MLTAWHARASRVTEDHCRQQRAFVPTLLVLSLGLAGVLCQWENEYDQPVRFACPKGQFLSTIQSIHDNQHEDRRWHFACSPVPHNATVSNCTWTDYVNEFDMPLTYSCPGEEYIGGIESVHNNHHEDRRFKFQCCNIEGAFVHQCVFTDYQNEFDKPLEYTVPESRILKGVSSYHDNHHEYFPLLLVLFCGAGVHSAWLTELDQPFIFNCPAGQFLSHLASYHDNHHEDRRWNFACHPIPAGTSASGCAWTGWINEYDAPMTYECPSDGFIAGIQSVHDNSKEDRRFKVQCCHLGGAVPHGCYFTDYQNNFDQPLDYTVPNGQILTGISSYHDNHFEDRRFKFEICTVG